MLAVFALNPLLYAWWHTAGGAYPDSIPYLQMSRDLMEHGRLFVAHAGHVDRALILPPLYPLAVGLFSALYDDPILVSQWLTAMALLACGVPLFLWIERLSNAWIAAAALIVAQWQPFYVIYGTSTLTESFFLLGVCSVAYAAGRLLERPDRSTTRWLALGAGVGVVFLARQIGVFLLPTLIAWAAVTDWRAGRLRATVRTSAALAAGFAAMIGPYALLLHAQTGQMPWTPSFRLNQYVVTAPSGVDQAAKDQPSSSYIDVYVERRAMRQLLPDATEMREYVVHETTSPGLAGWLAPPSALIQNLAGNGRHALDVLGATTLVLAAAGLVLSLLRGLRMPGAPWHLLMPAVILGYVAVLSLMTGLVDRYVKVMLPLVIGQAAVGAYLLIGESRARRLPGWTWPAAAVVLVGAMMLSARSSVLSTPLARKHGEVPNPLAPCRQLVATGEGVFSFHPIEAYLLGGTHRVVPNDTLDRMATYARLTGTRWLLFRPSHATGTEASLYAYADWLTDVAKLRTSADFVPRCGSMGIGAVLFEIAPARPPAARDLPGAKTE